MPCRIVLLSTGIYLLLVLNNASTTTLLPSYYSNWKSTTSSTSTSYSWDTTKQDIFSSKATCFPGRNSDISFISNISFWPSFILTIPFSFMLFKVFFNHFHKKWQTSHNVDISTLYRHVNGKVNKLKLLFKSITYSGIISTISTTIYILLSYDKCP
eukprot:104478_1